MVALAWCNQSMAGITIRACAQSSVSRQLIDIIWREQNVNYILQTLSIPYVQYQCYHVTPIFFKKRSKIQSSKMIFREETLYDSTIQKTEKKSVPIIEVWNEMTVTEFANSAKRDIDDILDSLHLVTKEMTFNKMDILPVGPLMINVVKKLGCKAKIIPKHVKEKEIIAKDVIRRLPPDKSQLVRRHPVVAIMGHVDHGKTTLLDALRNTSVVESEFGGITQHIGAFDVTLKSGERVTFLDTPGHAAFKSMRYRGAHITDIVVLVVAADDGVMDQTLQSIEMAKDANVPIIVAINKIDKPNADITRTEHELASHGIVIEKLGGEIQCVEVSALKGINLEQLTEVIVLQAELMDLKGDPAGLVEAVVIECSSHIGRGKLVTALIQRGTLKKGSLLVSGLASGKVRAMFNDSGRPILEAKPSEAVQIIGWKVLPNVGEEILEVETEKILQEVLKFREKEYDENLAMEHRIAADKNQESHLIEYKHLLRVKRLFGSNKNIIKQAKEKLAKDREENVVMNLAPTINVLLKGDAIGSVEALLDIFDTYKCDTICHLNVVHYGVGPITESDIELAETFNAIVYGFNVNTTKKIEKDANKKGVSLRFYNIVYKLIDNIKGEIYKVLPEVEVEEILGEAKVLQKFSIKDKKKKVNVAGCLCVKGVLLKSETYHVIRGNENIYTGKLESMRYLKEEKSLVEANLECGLRFEDPTISVQPGDTVVCFKTIKQKQQLDWDPGF